MHIYFITDLAPCSFKDLYLILFLLKFIVFDEGD